LLVSDQRAIAQSLYHIAVHYMAACFSLDADRGSFSDAKTKTKSHVNHIGSDSTRATVMGCILAVCDATIRKIASDTPSPLSFLLNGRYLIFFNTLYVIIYEYFFNLLSA
jgi:hypothetical protein